MQKIVTRAIVHGVYIITTRTKERINGMTAAWVSQVSLNPVMLMVAIGPGRFTHGLIKESGYFAVNTLSKDQIEIAKLFGFKSGRKHDKFQNIEYFNAPNGSPVLKDAIAYFECKLIDDFKAGDHSIFTGTVTDAKIIKENADPLIFKWEDYF
ncbi:MAG: flavin reductase [Nitrospirae bacterium]|jgi:flavin reductase (DIM6/NTAB) family NADH-FMN oxidoreductase RutF|nr:flavin reductase [Nitrospirota bacterium]